MCSPGRGPVGEGGGGGGGGGRLKTGNQKVLLSDYHSGLSPGHGATLTISQKGGEREGEGEREGGREGGRESGGSAESRLLKDYFSIKPFLRVRNKD